MPRYKVTVAYDGTQFHGWQRQRATGLEQDPAKAASDDPQLATDSAECTDRRESRRSAAAGRGSPVENSSLGDAQLRTVQQVLEHAVREVVREPVDVVGASRTDSGVHARGQVAAFTTTVEIPVEKLPRAITSRLPDDVQVSHAEIVPEDFDPIRGAIAKGYRYRIVHDCSRHLPPLFERSFVMRCAHRLDARRMNEAARLLLGEHDFASFARISHGRESTVRTIFDCQVRATSPRRLHIDVAGNGFLYNMVRIIAGTLVEISRRRDPEPDPQDIVRILEAKDRRAAGPTLPPEGLCLMWIKYGSSTPSS